MAIPDDYTNWDSVPISSTVLDADTAILSGSKRVEISDISAKILGDTFDNAYIAADGALYFGDPSTNGSYRVRRDDTYTSILWHEIRVSGTWTPLKTAILPTGDSTGATDQAAIQYALSNVKYVQLEEGTYYTDDTLTMSTAGATLRGAGKSTTIINRVNTTAAVLYVDEGSSGEITIADLTVSNGLHGIHLDATPHVYLKNVRCYYNTGNGLFLENGCWVVNASQSEFVGATLSGVNAIAVTGDGNGNALSLSQCEIRINTVDGVRWAANGLHITGCQIEDNGEAGVHIYPGDTTARSFSIISNRLEGNDTDIHLDAADADANKYIIGGLISGNYIYNTAAGTACILGEGSEGDIWNVVIDRSNDISATTKTYHVSTGNVARWCEVWENTSGKINMSYDTGNVIHYLGGHLKLPATGTLYLGMTDTNGSYRIRRSDTNDALLLEETRVGGSWVIKRITVLPSGDTSGATDYDNFVDATQANVEINLPGDYYVDDSWTLSSVDNVRITGGGSITQKTATKKEIYFNDCDNCSVDNMRLIGLGTEDPWSGGTYNGVAGIRFRDCNNLRITNCVLTNHAGGGIMFDGTCYDVVIQGNTIIGMGSPTIESGDNGADAAIGMVAGYGTSCHRLVISGNTIRDHAHGILGPYGQNLSITGNTIGPIPGQHAMYMQAGVRQHIAGNIIWDTAQDGIKVSLNAAADETEPVTISGNSLDTIGAIGINVSSTGSGVGYYQWNVSILNNTIHDADTDGMYLSYLKDAEVRNNVVRDSAQWGIDARFFAGSIVGFSARDCEYAAVQVDELIGDCILSEIDAVDTPLNVSAGSGGQHRSAIYLDMGTTSFHATLGRISMRFVDSSPPANLMTVVRQYSTAGSPTVSVTGMIENSEAVPKIMAVGTINGQIDLPELGSIYFGESTTDGTYRVRRDGTNPALLKHETRIGGSWITREIEVLPSGDATGATDYDNIQAAIDELTYAGGTTYVGTVWLAGNYTLDDVLVSGDSADRTKVSPNIRGRIRSRLEYAGTQTDDYFISMLGAGYNAQVRLENIVLILNDNARGILFSGQRWVATARDIYISDSRLAGFDAVDCWGAIVENIYLTGGDGFAFRAFRFNNGLCQSMRVGSWTTNTFPSATADSYCLKYDSTAWSLAAAYRAPIVIDDSGPGNLNCVTVESSNCGSYPMLHYRTYNFAISDFRAETCTANGPIIKQQGTYPYGRQNKVDGVTISTTSSPTAMVHLLGNSNLCSFSRISTASNLSTAFYLLDTGTHTANQYGADNQGGTPVSEIATTGGGVAANDESAISSYAGSLELSSTGSLYLGDASTNGSYRVRRDDTYTSILWHEIRVSGTWTPYRAEVMPSGDTTGATDTPAIQYAIDTLGQVRLAAGTYYTNATITLDGQDEAVSGNGWDSIISPANNTFAAFTITGDHGTLSHFRITGGLNGIDMSTGATRIHTFELNIYNTAEHGILLHNGAWGLTMFGGSIRYAGSGGSPYDGIHVDGATEGDGNAVSLIGTRLENNYGHGISWCGSSLAVIGACVIESNGDSGVHIKASDMSARGITIDGSYFEDNGTANIELEASNGSQAITGWGIRNNRLDSLAGIPNILVSDGTGDVRYGYIDASNEFSSASGSDHVNVADYTRYSHYIGLSRTWVTCTNPEDNFWLPLSGRHAITERWDVDCSADGTGQTVAIVTLPAGTSIHEVVAKCKTVFNGDTTKECQIGQSNTPNYDQWIDKLDFIPTSTSNWASMTGGTNNDQQTTEYLTAARNVVLWYTNTGNATTGAVTVEITYTLPPPSPRSI